MRIIRIKNLRKLMQSTTYRLKEGVYRREGIWEGGVYGREGKIGGRGVDRREE